MGMAVLLGGGLVAGQISDGVAGCRSVDPNDPSNYSAVHVLNGTAESVILDGCEGSYCGPQSSVTLGPGRQTVVDGACGASGSDMTSWRINGIEGRRLVGYIAIYTPRSTDNASYRVTRASVDRRVPTVQD